MMMVTGGLGAWLLLVSGASHFGADHREHVFPERNDDRSARATTWEHAGAWETSPPERVAAGGTRVAAALSVPDGGELSLQVRGVPLDSTGHCAPGRDAGPWIPMETTFRGSELQVEVADLDARYECAQIRMQEHDDVRVGDLQWELLEPRYPDAGRVSRQLSAAVPPPTAMATELETLGVISRAEWGARATQCSAPESDWHRMAIHHTAGPQTAGGTVAERLRGTQAYAMDSGGYCDVPYQMMVGFDGTLYEGRGLALQSGATGGGNNPGNLAVCFIGCYHEPQSQCVGGVGHQPTDEMMLRGQLLVQTLAKMHDISTADDNVRGHQDWPGNSTACPGSLLHPRLGELRADLAWFAGQEIERSWDDSGVDVDIGGEQQLWVEVENVGGLTWMPGETFLAPTAPRDEASPLHHTSWPADNRAATVEEPVEPGSIGRFAFTVSAEDAEEITQTFGLVHEGTTWFADAPWGGGPVDDSIVLTIRGIDPVEGGSTGDGGEGGDDSGGIEGTTGDPDATTGDDGSVPALPPSGDDGDQGCGCTSAPGGQAPALLLLALFWRRRRRLTS